MKPSDTLKQIKYILHGGKAQQVNEQNSEFFKEILKNTRQDISILLVYFASDPVDDQKNYEKDKFQFVSMGGDKKMTFRMATELGFAQQVKNSDIVYFGGGTTQKILGILGKYENLKEMLGGKVVALESAAANAFAKFSYSPTADEVFEGLGILPIKTIPHYREEFKDKLAGTPENFETLLLKEHEFRVIRI